MEDYRLGGVVSTGSSPLKHKHRPNLCISCCFGNNNNRNHHEILESSPTSNDQKPSLIKSPTSWLKSRVHNHQNHHEFPEFKEKCKNLFCKMGRVRRHSGDFKYDPLSYALNFDEGLDEIQGDEFPSRNFSSRLPRSPPIPSPPGKKVSSSSPSSVMVRREITAFS